MTKSSAGDTSCILILGNYRQTLTVIRSLAKTGHTIIVGREQKEFTELSRYTSEVWVHSSIVKQQEHFITQLELLLSKRTDIHYIFPVGEEEVACMERNRHRLPPSVQIIMPEKDVFFTAVDKDIMYKICFSAGIPIPQAKKIYTLHELQNAVLTVGFPVIVKPNDGFRYFFEHKAIICRTQQELDRFFQVWPQGNDFILLQNYIAGDRHNCHIFSIEGAIHAYFEHKTIRTDRINGTGVGVDNITLKPSPRLQDYCARLIKKMRYTGVCCVQFLLSKSEDKAYFLEMNPRLDANIAMPFRCGYDFPRFVFEFAKTRKKPPQPYSMPYAGGKRAHWFMGDIHGLDNEIKRGHINKRAFIVWIMKMFKTFMTADFHLTWWWRDPLPTLYLMYASFFGVVRRLRRIVSSNEMT